MPGSTSDLLGVKPARGGVYSWRAGDTIPVGANLTLRVIGTRLDEGTDGDPLTVLVVEPVA